MLLKLTGLWPYQSVRTRSAIIIFIFLFATSGILPQAIAVVKHLDNWDFIVECITSLTFDGICITKFVVSTLNTKKKVRLTLAEGSLRAGDNLKHLGFGLFNESSTSIACYKKISLWVGTAEIDGAWWSESPFFDKPLGDLRLAVEANIGSSKGVMLRMLNRMCTDWDFLARDRSVGILHEYAEKGRKMTIAYTVAGYTTCILFATQPVVPKIIDILLSNGTEPGEFPVPVDYLVIDEQEYYFYIIFHHSVTTCIAFSIVIANDCLFVVHVHHGCGLYAMLGHKLQQMGENTRPVESKYEMKNALDKLDRDFIDLASCVDRHNEAIEYAELIEATYSWCFLLILGLNMFAIITTGLQIVTATIEPRETLRFVVGNVFAMMHLCNECYMAQILMDHSISIRSYMLNSEWYRLPLKIQKFLVLMIMRCNVPSTITAGKMSIMSMEMFMTVLKASLTYFTVLRSI